MTLDCPTPGRDSAPQGDESGLTAAALIAVDYIDPPPAIAHLVTTLYHFRCDEAVIRDIRALRAAALLSAALIAIEDEAELGEAFFDQPHMIREITHFVGRTPARLSDRSTPYLAEMTAPRNLRELEPRSLNVRDFARLPFPVRAG